MHYFALLLGPESTEEPDAATQAAIMAAYQNFHAAPGRRSGPVTRWPRRRRRARISGGPDAPIVTDGPFAESAEVAGGYYVFEADNLDEALELARQNPGLRLGRCRGVADGDVEHPDEPWRATTGWRCSSSRRRRTCPGHAGVGARHSAHTEFGTAAGDHVLGGAAAASADHGDDGAGA